MVILADVPCPCLPQKLHVPLSELVGGMAWCRLGVALSVVLDVALALGWLGSLL